MPASDPDNYRANTPTEGQPFLTKTKLRILQGTTSAETKTSAAMSEVNYDKPDNDSADTPAITADLCCSACS